MTLTLEMPPETEAYLRQMAQVQGISVEELAVNIMMQAVGEPAFALEVMP